MPAVTPRRARLNHQIFGGTTSVFYKQPAFITGVAVIVLLTAWVIWQFRVELFSTKEERYQAAYDAGDFDTALQIALVLAEEDPSSARAQLGIAAVYIQKALNNQDVATSIAAARVAALKASDLDPSDPDVWRTIGYTYALQGDTKSAVENYQRALDFAPNDSAAITQLGLAYVAKGDLVLAERQFALAVQANSYDPQARLLLAKTRLAIGGTNIPEIETLIQPVLGSGVPILVADAKATLSKIRLNQGKSEEAENLAREAVNDAPNSVAANLALGEALYDGIFSRKLQWSKVVPEIQEIAAKVTKLEPTRAEAPYLAFRAAFLVGDKEGAAVYARQVFALLSKDQTLSLDQRNEMKAKIEFLQNAKVKITSSS